VLSLRKAGEGCRLHPFTLAATALALGGCATVAPRASFPQVSSLAAERGVASDVVWRGEPSDDAAADASSDDLLARPLDADAAVQVALLRNPTLQASYEELGLAQADLVQAGLLHNPVLSAAAMPAVGASASPKYEFDLAQNLFDLLLRPARTRIADAQLEEAKLRVAGSVVALAAEVRGAFVTYAAARRLTRVLEVLERAARASADLARRFHRAGNLSDLDLAREDATALQAQADVLRSRADQVAPHERLARLLAVPAAQTFSIVDELRGLPQHDPPLDELLVRADRQRLELAAARQEEAALQEALATAETWRYLGDVEVGAAASKDSGEGYFVLGPSASLELPIFDQKQAQIARLGSQLRRSRFRSDGVALDVASEVRSAVATLQAQRALAEHQRDRLVPLRREVTALSQQHYDYMQLGAFELLAAKQQEVAAHRDYLDALRDYWIAWAELERAVGGRLPVTAADEHAPSGADGAAAPSAPAHAGPAHHGGH